ncbi:uncharacterized protein MCAP_0864-like [Malaya genurostris]|uniref:uncharacterized protein MCAP_0864-like n=1 Tax=Malaya genurostris TaxID=325434 RepID=UPI0026F3FED6|nr:uncharacterized protein MCAP_0864-like [Malaya genurostris]
MHFMRTRALTVFFKFSANVKQIGVTDKGMMRLRRILSKIIVIARVPGTWMLVISVCMIGAQCMPLNHLGQPQFENDTLWLNPCNVHSYNESTTNKSKHITLAQRLDNLDRIKSSIIRTMQEIDQITSHSGKDTDWNTSQNRKKYMFLQPYKKNQSTWEPRVQVYLASIQIIHLKQVELERSKNLYKQQSLKLQELRQNAKGLLCEIQEYRNHSKTGNEKHKDTRISAKEMNSIINFDMTEEANMELHKWFLKCRFRCFLEDMEHHVNNLLVKFSKAKQTRKIRTTKTSKKKLKSRHRERNENLPKSKCCIVNNKVKNTATPRPPMVGTHKVNNNKKKLITGQQSKLIKPNQKKIQRKNNKKSVILNKGSFVMQPAHSQLKQ